MKDERQVTDEAPEPLAIPCVTGALSPVLLPAEPEPLEIDLQTTALLVVDRQKAICRKGGLFDLLGRDISKAQTIIEPIKKIMSAARAKGIKVIHIAHIHSSDLHNSGGPNSPNWYKPVVRAYREHPEWRDKCQFSGTWGAEFTEELKPEEGDIIVLKPRYSAFFGTHLDMILRTYRIKYLIFVGGATNICVGTTIRDAYNLDYFSILVSDATVNTGPSFMQEAEIFNLKNSFGWVTNTKNILKAINADDVQKVAAADIETET